MVGVHSLLTRARKRGVPVPTAASLNQVRRCGRPKGTRTAEMPPEVARRMAEMGKPRRMTAGELGAALLAALADEPVLVANLLDEAAP